MPQTYSALRNLFLHDGDDGILKAEEILRAYGATIDHGVIYFGEADTSKVTHGQALDALTYLVEEWDYFQTTREDVIKHEAMRSKRTAE